MAVRLHTSWKKEKTKEKKETKKNISLKKLLERLRFTFTPNGKREFVPRDQVSPLFFV